MMQLSLMDLWADPAPRYVPPVMRDVVTRAYGTETVMQIREDEPDPIEVEIDGVPCLLRYGFGVSTYAVEGPGSLFWSETGFRSFGGGLDPLTDLDEIKSAIRAYIAAPRKDGGGLGGKLVRWWPDYVNQWRGELAFILTYGRDRSKLWAQWGPEEHARIWAKKDAGLAEAVARMRAEGIDPNDVGPPAYFKGKWPIFDETDN